MIEQLTVGVKTDTPEKVTATAGLPADKKIMADELNAIVDKVKEVVSFINAITPVDITGKMDKGVGNTDTGATLRASLTDLAGSITTLANTKLTGTGATDAETQTSSAVTEDNKYVSRAKLFNWTLSAAFFSAVRAVTLNSISFGVASAVVGTDTVIFAIGKLQAQISALPTTLKSTAAENQTGTIDNKFVTPSGQTTFMNWLKTQVPFWTNTYFSGGGVRILTANAAGLVSANTQILEADIYVTDADIVTAASGGVYNTGNSFKSVITPANSKILYAGQYCFSGNYKYEAFADNNVSRILLG